MADGSPPPETTAPPRQRTLAGAFTIEGVGIHTGAEARAVFMPAPAWHGRTFVRADLPGAPELSASDLDTDPAPGRTALVRGEASAQTVEHVLAALSGLGVDNVRIELHSAEPPVGDGSARHVTEAIGRTGLVEQDVAREAIVVEEPVVVQEDGARLVALPLRPASNGEPLTRLGYALDYKGSSLARGWVEFPLTNEGFLRELAPARTFCMAADVERLQAMGLGAGATRENTLVIDDDRVLGNELRFPDELARHKALDLVGDLALLGAPVSGRIYGFRSGHRLNRELVRRLQRSAPRRPIGALPPRRVMGVADIEGILPHRYPFLLVDAVLELEPEKRIVAVKNVSRNEEFFQGHFPGGELMPGVLQVEALAQAAGLLFSKYVRAGGNMAVLVGLDRVKMRRPVLPGDRLLLNVTVKKIRRTLAICEGKVTAGGDVTAEATLLFGLIRDRSAPGDDGGRSGGGAPLQ
ncbi:MAG: UDP-3-O-acyl-N-acetylglucosamine deacetylase [Planctomycetota bacterium]|jgi:UDP-3-O-[3-hydroxymyristoyl] N-acetylglucosamine deacetylase/3-hydroxyacyl-[acyl-carrier-protein] dehydratase